MKKLESLFNAMFKGLSFRSSASNQDFYALREYMPFVDDCRQIEWKSVARYHKPYVKQFHLEERLDTWLIFDSSASMFNKKQFANQLVALLIKLFTEHLHNNAWLHFLWGANEVEGLSMIEPRKGIFLNGLQMVEEIELKGKSDLSALLGSLIRLLKRRSLIIVLTDLIDDSSWQQTIQALSLNNTVLLIQLIAPADCQLPQAGYLRVQDPESGRELLINSSDPQVRQSYNAFIQQQQEAIKTATQGHSQFLNLWSLNADKPLEDSLDELLTELTH